jgi:hypothetical protein
MSGLERTPPFSVHFTTIDCKEIHSDADSLAKNLATRIMTTKSSRSYLEKYGEQFDWGFLSQRLAAGRQTLRRGDFGEVVAAGWLEDFSSYQIPIKKLRLQINPGQSLPGTDAIAFELASNRVVSAHFLESKLRTTKAFLAEVGEQAYEQLVRDRENWFIDILQFVHERMFEVQHPLLDAVSTFLSERGSSEEDGHHIVLIVESELWDEVVLDRLDVAAGSLPKCTVHLLQVKGLANLVDQTFSSIGAELVTDMDDE